MDQLIKNYNISKKAKIGSICICPSCGTQFIKSNYQQAFCKTKTGTICKDSYWNKVDIKKRCNTTRISPASNRWKCLQYDRRLTAQENTAYDPHDDDHPFSSEALGQW